MSEIINDSFSVKIRPTINNQIHETPLVIEEGKEIQFTINKDKEISGFFNLDGTHTDIILSPKANPLSFAEASMIAMLSYTLSQQYTGTMETTLQTFQLQRDRDTMHNEALTIYAEPHKGKYISMSSDFKIVTNKAPPIFQNARLATVPFQQPSQKSNYDEKDTNILPKNPPQKNVPASKNSQPNKLHNKNTPHNKSKKKKQSTI